MRLVSAWLRIPFWQRVVAGFVLGALAGWLMGPAAETWFGPLGDLYVTLIKMIAVPLVFFAVINAISALHGQKSVAALGGRTFLWFIITAALAVAIGLGVGTVLQPGAGHLGLNVASNWTPRDVPSPIKVLLDVVPSNPFYALTGIGTRTNAAGETVLAAGRGSILPVIFFAALLGFAMVKLGERVAEARKLTAQMSDIMIQVTRFVLEVTPIGTFGLIAGLVGAYGFEKLLPLGNFVLALYLACALHIVLVYGGLLLAHGLNPLKFFRGARRACRWPSSVRRASPRCRWRCARSPTTWASTRTMPRSRCRWAPASRWTAAARSTRRCARCSSPSTPACR